MSACSAAIFGQAHPRAVVAQVALAKQLAGTSRAFPDDCLLALRERLAQVTRLDRAVPSNGGTKMGATRQQHSRRSRRNRCATIWRRHFHGRA
jgi:ornithine--oxo-acid transaminase